MSNRIFPEPDRATMDEDLSDECWEKIHLTEQRTDELEEYGVDPKHHLPLSEIDMSEEDNWSIFARAHEGLDLEDHDGRTTDMPALLRRNWIPVFVYGTLKEGFRNQRWLGSKAQFGGYAYSHSHFNMKRVPNTPKTAGFPVVFFEANVSLQARVFGEIWWVRPSTMRELDTLEANNTMYKRRELHFDTINDKMERVQIKAWVYVGEHKFWKDYKLLQCKQFQPNQTEKGKGVYYAYTRHNQDVLDIQAAA